MQGGCDGAEKSRKYYSQLGSSLPKSTLILTLGCAKYRINALDFGTLPGVRGFWGPLVHAWQPGLGKA